MSTPHNIEDALEAALIAWLNLTGTHSVDLSAFNIRGAEQDTSDRLTLPAIIVHVERQSEEIGTGVWECAVEVTMRLQADDTANSALVEKWNDLVAILYYDDLAAKLTTATLKTYACRYTKPVSHEAEERHYSYTFPFTVWACEIP